MNNDSEAFRQHLIGLACDPHSGLETQQRALLSLISLPSAAQKICTESEREHVTRTVQKAMDAAVEAATADLRDRVHYAEGVADANIKRADEAEAALSKAQVQS